MFRHFCASCLWVLMITYSAVHLDGQEVAQTAAKPDETVEAGSVQWGRDFEAAQAIAARTGKPIFLQFQEIPGCQTCQDYGKGPLSHPLLVEAIEDLFVPVLIHNNKSGEDERILKKFGERSWNNPVVRYLDKQGNDLIKPRENIWSVESTAKRMVAALKAHQSDVPQYLDCIAKQPARTESAIFAMHCYWEGEAQLGQLPGVRNTRSAWLHKKEVVEVDYDPAILSYETLLQNAQKMECASTVFVRNDQQQKIAKKLAGDQSVRLQPSEKSRIAKLSDQKYYLRNSVYRYLPLTVTQSTRINSVLMDQKNFRAAKVDDLLSPRQRKLQARIVTAVKRSPDGLQKFVFPDDDSKLAEYEKSLRSAIDSILAKR